MKVGDRIQLHPATDWWMRGARFGEIVRVLTPGKRGARFSVVLDRAPDMTVTVLERDVYEVLS